MIANFPYTIQDSGHGFKAAMYSSNLDPAVADAFQDSPEPRGPFNGQGQSLCGAFPLLQDFFQKFIRDDSAGDYSLGSWPEPPWDSANRPNPKPEDRCSTTEEPFAVQ